MLCPGPQPLPLTLSPFPWPLAPSPGPPPLPLTFSPFPWPLTPTPGPPPLPLALGPFPWPSAPTLGPGPLPRPSASTPGPWPRHLEHLSGSPATQCAKDASRPSASSLLCLAYPQETPASIQAPSKTEIKRIWSTRVKVVPQPLGKELKSEVHCPGFSFPTHVNVLNIKRDFQSRGTWVSHPRKYEPPDLITQHEAPQHMPKPKPHPVKEKTDIQGSRVISDTEAH